jgi:DNA-binding MarR family transcriptional regulator
MPAKARTQDEQNRHDENIGLIEQDEDNEQNEQNRHNEHDTHNDSNELNSYSEHNTQDESKVDIEQAELTGSNEQNRHNENIGLDEQDELNGDNEQNKHNGQDVLDGNNKRNEYAKCAEHDAHHLRKRRMDDGLGILIHHIDHAVYFYHNEDLKRFNMTFQQAVILNYIFDHGGCNQRQIESKIERKGSSVAVLIRTMTDKGLIDKKRDPADGRNVILTLTKKGLDLVPQCRQAFDEMNQHLIDGLNADELSTMKSLLKRVLHNIAPEFAKYMETMEHKNGA